MNPTSSRPIAGRALRTLLCVLAMALAASVLSVSSAAQPASAAPAAAQSTGSLPVYDTAWELPMLASFAEIETYLDHLQKVGFAGTWVSFFDLLKANLDQRSPEGDVAATLDGSGFFVLNAKYLDRVERILDMASERNLTVSIVPIWASVFVNGRGNQCNAPNSGPLFDWNAYGLGRQLGERFGSHPAVGQWIMGGDNYCGYENVEIWRQLSYGLADYGADQPTTYHSPAIQDRQRDHLWESWLDFAAPQTGHCQNHEHTRAQLENVVRATDKPVLAAELRYEGIQPAWNCPEHGPGRPVTADDVESDVRSAMGTGVSGILYGHNERWQWGIGIHGSSGGGGSAAIASLGSPGEKRMLKALGISNRKTASCTGDKELKSAAAKATREARAAAKVAAAKLDALKVANKKASRTKAAAAKAVKAAKSVSSKKPAEKAAARTRAAKKKAAAKQAASDAVDAQKVATRTAERAKKKAAAAKAAQARSAAAC